MFWFPGRDFFFLFLLREGKLYDLSSVGCFISLGWSKAEHISTAHIHCKCRTCHKLIFQSLHNPVFLLTGLLNARSLHRKNKLSFKKEKKIILDSYHHFFVSGGWVFGGIFFWPFFLKQSFLIGWVKLWQSPRWSTYLVACKGHTWPRGCKQEGHKLVHNTQTFPHIFM